MLINPLGDGNKSSESNKIKKKKSSKSNKSSSTFEHTSFFDLITDAEIQISEKELKMLINNILDNGNRFVKSPTPINLKYYKEAIKEYLKKIEKKLFRMKEEIDIETETPRLHVIAEVVDEKIKDLTEAIIKKEKGTIFFASKVEEINGLLIDLYM